MGDVKRVEIYLHSGACVRADVMFLHAAQGGGILELRWENAPAGRQLLFIDTRQIAAIVVTDDEDDGDANDPPA